MAKPKVLVYDCESLPNEGWFFDIFSDRGIPLAFVNKPKSLCTIAYKWLGESKTTVIVAEAPYDDKSLLQKFMPIWEQADYTIAHYGSGFDEPLIAARLMANNLSPLPPVPGIDTYKLAKKHFGRSLNSNKLDHLAYVLDLGSKNKTDATLWVRCAKGEKKAMKEMADYNIQDVVLLEKVALKLLPYFSSKLNQNLFKDKDAGVLCESCGSADMQKRGTSVTKSTKRQRFQCQMCAHWQVGKYEKETHLKITEPHSKSRKKARA